MDKRSATLTGLLVLCVLSAGCERGQHGPAEILTLTSVSPSSGATRGFASVTLTGTGFRPGATVSFDGVTVVSRVAGDTTIFAGTPPHGPGPVDVIVTNEGGLSVTLSAAFTYLLEGQNAPPPLITAVSPANGSTGGGATVVISGTGFRTGAKVTFGGVPGSLGVLNTAHLFDGSLYVTTPPHGAGAVTVVVTNVDGQSATLVGGYTYATPGSFDFNGEWDGGTGYDWQTPVPFTIKNNAVVSASCGGVPLPIPFPPPMVTGGEFSIISDGIAIMTGRIVTDTFATGTINTGPCGKDGWAASKR